MTLSSVNLTVPFKLTKESEVSLSQEDNNLPEQDKKVASKWLNELKNGLNDELNHRSKPLCLGKLSLDD